MPEEIPSYWGVAGDMLRQLVETNKLGHAYLLCGPSGSGKVDAAWFLARAVVCADQGCGTCDDCLRIARRMHPDVHHLRPQSAHGYLVDQIRSLIDDVSLAPIRSNKKVYILEDAHALTVTSANALLKNLEEPPTDTVFILVANSKDMVLPTILSRCQVLQFPALSPAQATLELSRSTGKGEDLCRRALSVCAELDAARSFLSSESRQSARTTSLNCLASLQRMNELDVIRSSQEIVLCAKETLADLEARHADEVQTSASVLSSAGLKELEERHKRELAAAERSGIIECLNAQRALLRDALLVSTCTTQPLGCDDYGTASKAFAAYLGTDGIVKAIRAVESGIADIERNATPRMAIESMLFNIKEIFPCRP